MTDFDAIFNHAVTTADFTNIKGLSRSDLKVNIQSQAFSKVLELSIRNGENAAFAKLLRFIPDLTLKTRSHASKPSKQQPIHEVWWNVVLNLPFRRVGYVITELLLCIGYYYTLSFIIQYIMLHSSGLPYEVSAWLFDHLQIAPSPFSVRMWMRPFLGIKQRFSQEFFLDSLDGGLLLLCLAIGTRAVSQSSWIGGCIHEGYSSAVSFKGQLTRGLLNQYMPIWRRRYIIMLLGHDHGLATATRVQASVPQREYCESVLEQLFRSKCNEQALMIEYFEAVTFDNINENCEAGHEILLWAAGNGFSKIIKKLLSLGIDLNLVVADSSSVRLRGPPSGSALYGQR